MIKCDLKGNLILCNMVAF